MNKRMREVPLGALMAAVEIMDADFDSAIPRFESWRPSHPVRSLRVLEPVFGCRKRKLEKFDQRLSPKMRQFGARSRPSAQQRHG